MNNFNEQIIAAKERAEQLKRQQGLQDNREKTIKRKTDSARQKIIGKTVSKYFPEVMDFKPRRTVKENDIEFAPLADFLSALAADKEYVALLKEKVRQKQSQKDQQRQ